MTAMRPKRAYNRRQPIPPKPAPVHHEQMQAPTETASAPQTAAIAPERTDLRQEMRPNMREEDPRARAKARAQSILGHLPDPDEGVDEFRINADEVPDGWTYEWKRDTTLGAKDPSYEVSLAQTGWEPVPVSRHPAFMPAGWTGKVIERKGMVLMERPKEITDLVRERERQAAMEPVRGMQEKLSGVQPGQFARQKSSGESLVKVAKSYEPMAIPDD